MIPRRFRVARVFFDDHGIHGEKQAQTSSSGFLRLLLCLTTVRVGVGKKEFKNWKCSVLAQYPVVERSRKCTIGIDHLNSTLDLGHLLTASDVK